MPKLNLITRLLCLTVVQSAIAAWALADDPVRSIPPPPSPIADDVPAPGQSAIKSAPLPAPNSVSPMPAPLADATASGNAGPCVGSCHTCLGGCCCVDCNELPFGACVKAHLKTQICNGLAARFVLYQYDFCDETTCDGFKLSPKGYERLEEIARLYPASNFQSIVIERTPQDPNLDAARRDYVWRTLLAMNMPVPDRLVVVGRPRTPSLNGQEALILHLNLLKQTQASGVPAGGGGGGTGTTGGGAGGGAAGGTGPSTGMSTPSTGAGQNP